MPFDPRPGRGEARGAPAPPYRDPGLGSTTSVLVVMQILARRAAGTAADDEVVCALTYLESYFVRRIVTGRATANLNRTLLQRETASN
ncbi:hypothetical protein AB6813_01460 [bacterium RCC_150]